MPKGNYKHKIKHGMINTKTYHSWATMKQRCLNPNNPDYKYYGNRGIEVCKKWMSFENFYRDMGERPENKSLDRISNSGNYELSNCCWSTQKEQTNNKRNNRLITYKGRTQNISQWAKEINIPYSNLYQRLTKYNWSIKRSLSIN